MRLLYHNAYIHKYNMEVVNAVCEINGEKIRYIKSAGWYFFYVRDVEEILDVWDIRREYMGEILTTDERAIYSIPGCYNSTLLMTAHGLHKIVKYESSPLITDIRRVMCEHQEQHAKKVYMAEMCKLFPGETNVVIDGVEVDLYLLEHNIAICYRPTILNANLIVCNPSFFITVQQINAMIIEILSENIKNQEVDIEKLRLSFGI